jgi:hypothetical protein
MCKAGLHARRAAVGAMGAIVLAVSGAGNAGAQNALVRLPSVGSRVRLTSQASPGARITGVLRVVYGDSIVVQRDDRSTVALAQGDLAQVEVRVGQRQAEQLATAFGIAGALGGGAVYVNWCRQNPRDCQDDAWGEPAEDESRLKVPSLLVMGGALLGAGIGYVLSPPRWKTVDAPVRVGVVPLGTRGVAVGARLSVDYLGR